MIGSISHASARAPPPLSPSPEPRGGLVLDDQRHRRHALREGLIQPVEVADAVLRVGHEAHAEQVRERELLQPLAALAEE
jgi:hypothetical protein